MAKRKPPPPKVKCRQCGDLSEWDACWWCTRRCKRKVLHLTREEALIARMNLIGDVWNDPALDVFKCKVQDEPHYHLGHAKGQRAKFLRHKAERLRRKALTTALELTG